MWYGTVHGVFADNSLDQARFPLFFCDFQEESAEMAPFSCILIRNEGENGQGHPFLIVRLLGSECVCDCGGSHRCRTRSERNKTARSSSGAIRTAGRCSRGGFSMLRKLCTEKLSANGWLKCSSGRGGLSARGAPGRVSAVHCQQLPVRNAQKMWENGR